MYSLKIVWKTFWHVKSGPGENRSTRTTFHCQRWSGLAETGPVEASSFDSRKWSCCADGNPPGTLPVLNISFCQKLPLSVRTPLAIKVVPSVTPKVAPYVVLSTWWWKVSTALQTDLQLLQCHLCPSSTLPSLLNLLCTFCSQVEGEHHPVTVIARGTNCGSHEWSFRTIIGPRPIFVTVLFGFVPAVYLTGGTVMVLSLLYTHDDVIIQWVKWPNTLRSTVEGVLLVAASKTCSSVKWDGAWTFEREQVLLCTGWLDVFATFAVGQL